MAQNNFSQLLAYFGINLAFNSGITILVDSISGFFLIILAVAVLFEYAGRTYREEVARKSSLIAITLMGALLVVELLLGRYGIGQIHVSSTIRDICAIIGCVLVVKGVILNLIARFELGLAWSNNIVVYRDQKLVDRGLYAIVRHPLYATIHLISIGLFIQYQNYISLIISVGIFLPLLFMRMNREEYILREHMAGYIEYSKNVPMFFPRLRGSCFFKNCKSGGH